MAKYKWYNRKKTTSGRIRMFEPTLAGTWVDYNSNITLSGNQVTLSPGNYDVSWTSAGTYDTTTVHTIAPTTYSIPSTWAEPVSVGFSSTTINEDAINELTAMINDNHANPDVTLVHPATFDNISLVSDPVDQYATVSVTRTN